MAEKKRMKSNEIVCVIGPKGSGKSFETNQRIQLMERVVIFDMIKDETYAETVLPEDGPMDENNCIIEGEPRVFATAIHPSKESFKVIYRPVLIEMKDNGIVECPEFGKVTELVHLRGDCWYVVDEAHLLANSHNCPKELMLANYIGRHNELSMLFVAQSFTGIHPNIRRNADTFIFWRIIEPADLEAIRKRCGKDVEEQVRNLRVIERDPVTKEFVSPGQFLVWDKLNGVVKVTE
jgi:hypothetical protein